MQRDILNDLQAWKDSPHRKPLVLKGARQVGKTWALKELGATSYRNCVYLSLEEIAPGVPSEYAQLFETTRDPRRIAANISLAVGQEIAPGDTLLILDEVQDCPAAIGALKYFCDEAPEYHVACAGSLLGVHLAREGSAFPVGKVNFLDMHPLTFSEYLRAVQAESLDAFANGIDGFAAVPDVFANQLSDHLKRFLVSGGMPEAVARATEGGAFSVAAADKVLGDLLDSYERDFAKHGGKVQFAKLSLVWHSVPTHLARENKKFVWGAVRKGARAREYEDAVEWLSNAGLLARVHRNEAKGVPLSAYDDAASFKAYLLDVGLLRRLAQLDASVFSREGAPFVEFKGSFAENYILQALTPQLESAPRYWTNDKPKHEVDFLIQVRNEIVPVEVKSGEAVHSASLRYYAQRHEGTTPLRVRFSQKNLAFDGNLLNIPLYLAHRAVPLIEAALDAVK